MTKIKSDLRKQMSDMLKLLKSDDDKVHSCYLLFLDEVFKAYNSGKTNKLDKLLIDIIDSDVKIILW